MVFRNGVMEPFTKDSGMIIKHVDKELSGMLKAISILENFKMIKQMALESILMSMEASILVSG